MMLKKFQVLECLDFGFSKYLCLANLVNIDIPELGPKDFIHLLIFILFERQRGRVRVLEPSSAASQDMH